MSNMHVLIQANGAFRIVAHVAIPAGANSAGVAWRTAVVNSGIGGRTILPAGDGTAGTISAAEATAITTAGSVFEDVTDLDLMHDVTLSGISATPSQLGGLLDAWYAGHAAVVLATLQNQLVWFGQTR